ncbi:MAG: Crp/Fnr family transcriptional regulator, partial [Bacteroidota bacterium]
FGIDIYDANGRKYFLFNLLTKKDLGEEVVYDVLTKGDFFGNLKYLNGQFFEFSKVLVDTEVRYYDLTFFKELIVSDPEISDWFHFYTVKRWCDAEFRLIKINARHVMEKLQFLYDRFGIDIYDANGRKYFLFNLLTKKDLGDIIGATRQTVASSLKKFKMPG